MGEFEFPKKENSTKKKPPQKNQKALGAAGKVYQRQEYQEPMVILIYIRYYWMEASLGYMKPCLKNQTEKDLSEDMKRVQNLQSLQNYKTP